MDESYQWSLFLQSDKQAFSEIFLAFYDDLSRYGAKLTNDPKTVDDCIQNLFLKLWKNRRNLKPVENIKPYLFRSLRNHLIDIQELKKITLPINNDIEDLFVIEFTAEDFLISTQVEEEKQNMVIKLLNHLTPRQRHAIYLRYFEEMEFDTIAQILDMQVQSVRNLISRGLNVMRDVMLISFLFILTEEASPLLSKIFL